MTIKCPIDVVSKTVFLFALQITAVRFPGTFLSEPGRVSIKAQRFVGKQLSIYDMRISEDYGKRETPLHEYSDIIRK